MLKKLSSMLLFIMLIACTIPNITYATENISINSIAVSVSGCSVKTQTVNGTEYLFLPSGADCSSVKICGIPSNSLISIDELAATNVHDNIWDLGKIESGTKYTLGICSSDDPSSTRNIILMKSNNISSLFVTGDKDIEFLNSDKNNISKDGTVIKLSADGNVLVDSALSKIKGRGHTTWTNSKDKNPDTSKKPYNLTTMDKVQLIADGNSKEKKWTLLSGSYNDYSGAMNATALSLYKSISGDAYVDYEPIDFYYNGEYRGLYLITDKVEVDDDLVNINKAQYTFEDTENTTTYICEDYDSHFDETLTNNAMWSKAKTDAIQAPFNDRAINAGILAYSYATNSSVSADGGILFEISHQYYDEACWFITNRGVMISLKSPEYATQKQVQDIAIYVQEFENALMSETGFNSKGKHYTEYIDIKSLAKSFLLNCFTSQNDFFDCSEFFFIDGDDTGFLGKIKSGPAWDYDVSHYGNSIYSTKSAEGKNGRMVWLKQFLTKGDFLTELHNLQKNQFASAVDTISNKTLPDYKNSIEFSAVLDQAMWLYDTSTSDKFSFHQRNIANRQTAWENIWSDKTNSIRGIIIKEENGSLISSSSGAIRYQWYKIEKDYTKGTAIAGATDSSYTPTASGIYYASAYGTTLPGTNVYVVYSNPIVYNVSDAPKENETVTPFVDISTDAYYFNAVLWATQKNITNGASNKTFSPDAKCNRGQMATFLWRAAGRPKPTSNTCEFEDVDKSDYYYEAVLWAVENGITNGTSATTFSPNQTIDRAQAVTFISRLANSAPTQNSSSFVDIDVNSYYFSAIQWAVENGITTGTSSNTFSPHSICTRGQIVTFLHRFFTS